MKRIDFKVFLIAAATAIAVATVGCNLPGSSSGDDDNDDPYYPEYTYVYGQANHVDGQSWNVSIEYQCPSDPSEVGVIVMHEDTEVRRVIAQKNGSAYPPEGTFDLNFTWQTGEEGCTVVPFVSTSTEGVTTGYEITMPFGIVVNSTDMRSLGDGTFNIAINYFCDCNIYEGTVKVYDTGNNMVAESSFYMNGYGSNQNSEVTFNAFDNGLMPKTEYRAVISLTTEYNSATSECNFTTPAREPYAGDNNPPQV